KNNILFKVLRRIGLDFSKRIKEDSLLFNDGLLKVEDHNYIDGYFQCEKYFKDIREILLKQFCTNKGISNYTKKIEKKIFGSKHSCSLHIRRGDFVDNININIHGSCDLEYYQNAIEVINLKYENTHFFIFSDDIDWCKQNLKIKNAVYIDSEEKRIPHEDIYLMSLCNHNIIANSSFSWWGAWLSQNKEKMVIAPKRWFVDDNLERQSKDIVCDGWMMI
ncbi:alpha-1,2-fucosyltransferase, partial [bacterium]|nr:alpha-1,2-fucosyltransferase [bacterium]